MRVNITKTKDMNNPTSPITRNSISKIFQLAENRTVQQLLLFGGIPMAEG